MSSTKLIVRTNELIRVKYYLGILDRQLYDRLGSKNIIVDIAKFYVHK